MDELQKKFDHMHLLDRSERRKLVEELHRLRPDFLIKYVPKWWWWQRCKTHVLVVADRGINFGTGPFELSEFLTTFNKLKTQTGIDYQVTLAHRGNAAQSPNPAVVSHLSGFNFSKIDLNQFDQIWMFAFSTVPISDDEVKSITGFMDNGGGVFATGDHGNLGIGMCGKIPRVSEMRYWDNFPVDAGEFSEVAMTGKRRNDTNEPKPENSSANTFDHQSDIYPQKIGVRTFGQGMPHPLLSVSQAKRASGIIDIMPDHPHEGECKPETSFLVNGTSIPTQIIATSFVKGGNIAPGKAEAEPHCFSSIAVWNGRQAGAGRIVVDSTWHHFININLNGVGTVQPGLTDEDFDLVQQYYMNIATWISRRQIRLCWGRWQLWELFRESQLVEASLENTTMKSSDLTLKELRSIGALAEELLADKFGPSISRDLLVETLAETKINWADILASWNPLSDNESRTSNPMDLQWLNMDVIFHASLGMGFIALRDDKNTSSADPEEKCLKKLSKVFAKGAGLGAERAIESLSQNIANFEKNLQ